MTSLVALIEKLRSGSIKSVVALIGAGISVNAGLPDFRSPGGLYATLQPQLLTATEDQKRMMAVEPTLVVDYNLFRHNQFPYLEVQ